LIILKTDTILDFQSFGDKMSHLVASIQIEISVVVLLLVQDLGQLLSFSTGTIAPVVTLNP
jgi:hypothetical protein